MSPPRILDGRALAEARAPALAARARQVASRRGRPPRLLLLAFRGRDGEIPHLQGKVRACARVGVEAHPVLLDADTDTGAAVSALAAGLQASDPDGVFVQFPLAEGVAAAPLAACIPARADVDAMRPTSIAGEGDGPAATGSGARLAPDGDTPLTALAMLALLDDGGVELVGRAGVLVADPDPYHARFREVLVRRGVRMAPLVSPLDPDVEAAVRRAELVVVSAARPGVVPAGWLAPGSVVVDAGYFNGGGRGDVDVSGGVAHLAALAPVPGGVGPMTVSALIEAVVARAELRA
ncbi:MAG: tetrahydrofolate dehydrogenase/cyclohydrolase catalytic domain-containing protein [Longimicrobiales bacterium]|nr:tetrahydrofolate dehydrogenase/cyclohydrolase catalytic domain-containing protein [Longimicrobiales bacterium]